MKILKKLAVILLNIVCAAEVAVVADAIRFLAGDPFSFWLPCAVFLFVFALLMLTVRKMIPAVSFTLAVPLLCAAAWFGTGAFVSMMADRSVYRETDSGKAGLFAGHNVMIFVPHEDDEINLAGGVTEEYLRYGSEVRWVFYTNGDYNQPAEIRYREALASASICGVPADHVIFLGYGDQWAEDRHIYNETGSTPLYSMAGHRETYGTSVHSAWREGQPYVRENVLADLRDLLLTYRPDVIFCNDYDAHIDHRALSMFFETAVGMVLKQHPDYRPEIFKGFAYSTAWNAPGDFYADNILSTQQPARAKKGYMAECQIWQWKDRVRFPVSVRTLSRLIHGSSLDQALACHDSQNAEGQAVNVINGDKVFWRRDTHSLTYDAEVRVSSGNAALLNDFMLCHINNLFSGEKPYEGTWIPDASDTERKAEFVFPETRYLEGVMLFDHPDRKINVTEALLTLDNGTEITIPESAIDHGGTGSWIPVQAEAGSFTLSILASEGNDAGWTEIEAYGARPAPSRFIKLMDEEENFVYDQLLTGTDTINLTLYRCGDLPAPGEDSYQIACGNNKCRVNWDNGRLLVTCPSGQSTTVTVSLSGTDISDTVTVSNVWNLWPGLQQLEQFFSQDPEDILDAYRKDHPFLLTEEEKEELEENKEALAEEASAS